MPAQWTPFRYGSCVKYRFVVSILLRATSSVFHGFDPHIRRLDGILAFLLHFPRQDLDGVSVKLYAHVTWLNFKALDQIPFPDIMIEFLQNSNSEVWLKPIAERCTVGYAMCLSLCHVSGSEDYWFRRAGTVSSINKEPATRWTVVMKGGQNIICFYRNRTFSKVRHSWGVYVFTHLWVVPVHN